VLSTVLVAAWLASGVTEVPAAQSPAPTASTFAPPTADRIQRVELWLKAVLHHQPGSADDAATEVASWSDNALETLTQDLEFLVLQMRHPDGVLTVPRPGRRPGPRYFRDQALARRFVELACAAGGIALVHAAAGDALTRANAECVKRKVIDHLDEDLQALDLAAAEARGVGADNYVLKRGALLHSDIAILSEGRTSPLTRPPQPYRDGHGVLVDMSDGQATGYRGRPAHWEIARVLLDRVRHTRNDEKPAPGRDEMVRDWYYATAAWMLYHKRYYQGHLDHGVALFPNDASILFLAAAEHETYAGPYVQSVMRTATLPPGATILVGSEKEELHKSEVLFKRALAANASLVDAHLRLGHVLALLGRPHEAEPELREAIMSATSDLTRYYGELFLARVKESLGDLDPAAPAYERASALFPNAQSPLVGLAALAHRRGDRRATLMAAEKFFALPRDDEKARDPWWIYYIAQDLNADALVDDVRRPFVSAGEPGAQRQP
jgi:hypothetical protein